MRSLAVGIVLVGLASTPVFACVEEDATMVVEGRLESSHPRTGQPVVRQLRPDTPLCVTSPYARFPTGEPTMLIPAPGVVPTALPDEAHVRVVAQVRRDDGVNLALHYSKLIDLH